MSEFLNNETREQVRKALLQMQSPVQILLFTAKEQCETCADTHQLLEEVASISTKIEISIHDLQDEAPLAAQFRIDKTPSFVVVAQDGKDLKDTGIQYSGIPSGHEFTTLIQDLLLVSNGDSGLKPDTRKFLKSLQVPVHLQVFVTPTCPYCPQAVFLAHRMAFENPTMIRAEGVESMEFQELAAKFNVMGVPQTTLNQGAGTVIGAVPEMELLAKIQHIAA